MCCHFCQIFILDHLCLLRAEAVMKKTFVSFVALLLYLSLSCTNYVEGNRLVVESQLAGGDFLSPSTWIGGDVPQGDVTAVIKGCGGTVFVRQAIVSLSEIVIDPRGCGATPQILFELQSNAIVTVGTLSGYTPRSILSLGVNSQLNITTLSPLVWNFTVTAVGSNINAQGPITFAGATSIRGDDDETGISSTLRGPEFTFSTNTFEVAGTVAFHNVSNLTIQVLTEYYPSQRTQDLQLHGTVTKIFAMRYSGYINIREGSLSLYDVSLLPLINVMKGATLLFFPSGSNTTLAFLMVSNSTLSFSNSRVILNNLYAASDQNSTLNLTDSSLTIHQASSGNLYLGNINVMGSGISTIDYDGIFYVRSISLLNPNLFIILLNIQLTVFENIYGDVSSSLQLNSGASLFVPNLSPIEWNFSLYANSSIISFVGHVTFTNPVRLEGQTRALATSVLYGSSVSFTHSLTIDGYVRLDADDVTIGTLYEGVYPERCNLELQNTVTHIQFTKYSGAFNIHGGSVIFYDVTESEPSLFATYQADVILERPGGTWREVVMNDTSSSLLLSNTMVTIRLLTTPSYQQQQSSSSASLSISDSTLAVDQSPSGSLSFSSFYMTGDSFARFYYPGTFYTNLFQATTGSFQISGVGIIAQKSYISCPSLYCLFEFDQSSSIDTIGVLEFSVEGNVTLSMSNFSYFSAGNMTVDADRISTVQNLYIRGGQLQISNLHINLPRVFVDDIMVDINTLVIRPNSSFVFLQTKAVSVRSITQMDTSAFIVYGPCGTQCVAHRFSLLSSFTSPGNIGVHQASINFVTEGTDARVNMLHLKEATVTIRGTLIIEDLLYVEGDRSTFMSTSLTIASGGSIVVDGKVGVGVFIMSAPITFNSVSEIKVKDALIVWGGTSIDGSGRPPIEAGDVYMWNAQFLFVSSREGGANNAIFLNSKMRYMGDNTISASSISFLGGGAQWYPNASVVVEGALSLSPGYETRLDNTSLVYLVTTVNSSFSWQSQLDTFNPSPYMVVSGSSHYLNNNVVNQGVMSVQPVGTSLLQPSSVPGTIVVDGVFRQYQAGELRLSIMPTGCDAIRPQRGRLMSGKMKLDILPASVPFCTLVYGRVVNESIPEQWDFEVPPNIAQTSTITLTGTSQGIVYSRWSSPQCPSMLPYMCDVSTSQPSFEFVHVSPTMKVKVTSTSTALWTFDSSSSSTQLTKTPLTCFPDATVCATSQGRGAATLSCTGPSPFLCNKVGGGGPECAGRPSLCSVGLDASLFCWDGSNNTKCPVLPRCPVGYEQRCADGTCLPATSICPQSPNCLIANRTRCADGICRSSCPSFDGCGLDRPFHCSDGRCVKTWDRCSAQPAGPAACPAGQCKCPNSGQCRASCALCIISPLAQQKPVPMKVLLNLNDTLMTVTVPGQQTENNSTTNNYLCNVTIPYGAINAAVGGFVSAFVYIEPLPDSSLYSFLPPPPINSSSTSDDSDDDDDDYDLSYLRSSVVNITASLEDYESSTVTAVTNFSLPIGIMLRIHKEDVPLLSGFCLAYVADDDHPHLNSSSRRWECVDGNLTLVGSAEEGVVIGYTTHFTSYAIIVNYRMQGGSSSSSTGGKGDDDITTTQTSPGGISLEVVVAVPIAAVVFVAGAIGVWLYVARMKRRKEEEKEIKGEDLSL
eukprot:TRINITY_DN3667_c0_g1_i1.p1 TRINITY_DN3667_c0_g1~~TRINITY_DN3667_c0_g1_i1.p1  ORF type:complete len:1654 (-),score=213.25 TRINITY_DN3667_c0_g1_i1:46-5007(-)